MPSFAASFATAMAALTFTTVARGQPSLGAIDTVDTLPSPTSAPVSRTTPAPAAASLGSTSPSPPAPTKQTYSGQMLLADGTAFTMLFVGLKSDLPALTLLGATGYVVGGPIVHGAHRQGGAAALSAVMRLGLPLGCALLGYTITSGGRSDGLDGLGGAVGGFAVGMIIPPVIDAAVLARHDWPERLPTTPSVSLRANGAGLSVSGAF